MNEGVEGFLAYLSVMHVAFSGFPRMQVRRSSSIYRFREILCFRFHRIVWLFCQGYLEMLTRLMTYKRKLYKKTTTLL